MWSYLLRRDIFKIRNFWCRHKRDSNLSCLNFCCHNLKTTDTFGLVILPNSLHFARDFSSRSRVGKHNITCNKIAFRDCFNEILSSSPDCLKGSALKVNPIWSHCHGGHCTQYTDHSQRNLPPFRDSDRWLAGNAKFIGSVRSSWSYKDKSRCLITCIFE